MKKYLIERQIPQVGSLDRHQLSDAAEKSNQVLRQLGPDIQWVESFVTADKMFCVYLAEDKSVIQRHAEISGYPATTITDISDTLDTTAAENIWMIA